MESYHKRKKKLEEKYGKLISVVRPHNKSEGIASGKQQNYVKQLQDISDEEGLKRAYEAKDGLYQHYNKIGKAHV